MKISSKGRYGLKLMVDLSVFGRESLVSLKSVAARHHMSELYLEQLAAALKKAGLITAVRGATGGYALGRPAETITVGEILRALEGPIREGRCGGGCGDVCESCISKSVWGRLNKALDDAADSIRLSELAEDYENMDKTNL